ncbi:MAG TPA: amino acid permease, partial [Bacteroidota bacterium]|nr:amino acid permease [Bacteroidota bacterium]
LILFTLPISPSTVVLEPAPGGLFENWRIFVGIILAISGIESISNMTGVMKDPIRNSRRAILIVLSKITLATIFLGLAMLAIPNLDTNEHKEEMIRFLGESYVGNWFGPIVGGILGLLLISAGNTAINALTSIQFLMSVDKELPMTMRRLNKYGVPVVPLIVATLVPIIVLFLVHDVLTLAQMYAIGVVGAILINIGSTATDRSLKISTPTRLYMTISSIILLLIETTIVVEKTKAVIFASSILAIGLTARMLAKRQEQVVPSLRPVPVIAPASAPFKIETGGFTNKIMVSVRGGGEKLLRHACEEAKLRKSFLFILQIKQIAVVGLLPDKIPSDSFVSQDWMEKICHEYEIPYRFISIISSEVGYTIAEQAATLGVDRLILGATQRTLVERALRGDVLRTVSELLPEEIQLVIYRA